MKVQRPPCRMEGALTLGWCVIQITREVILSASNSEMLAWLTYCLHLLTHSCTAFFFLVSRICWFLSLLLGLCPRHSVISVFVFGSHGGGRYLHLDTNVNIIHPQVNNSNKIQGPETPRCGREGCEMLLLGQGRLQHHCLGLCITSSLWSYCLFRTCSPMPFSLINLNSASCFHRQKTPLRAACVWKRCQSGSCSQA